MHTEETNQTESPKDTTQDPQTENNHTTKQHNDEDERIEQALNNVNFNTKRKSNKQQNVYIPHIDTTFFDNPVSTLYILSQLLSSLLSTLHTILLTLQTTVHTTVDTTDYGTHYCRHYYRHYCHNYY